MERYKIQKRIGKGSFGSVFLVTDQDTGLDAVVKRVPLVELSDKERDQAKLEVQLMQNLEHPYLVTHLDSFLYNGEDLVIVMEFYRGGDLSGYLSARGDGKYLDELVVVRILTQLSLALQYMHSRRVLHRDIKAQNIFLQAHAEDPLTKAPRAVIGDLGIAKVLGHTMAMAKTAIGTPLYMSPEVCEGDEYSYASDIWSLGCVFYELCALKHPFQSRDLSGLVMKILTANYPALPPGLNISKPYTDLLRSMLSKSPRRRPTADDILQSRAFRSHAVALCDAEEKRSSGGGDPATSSATPPPPPTTATSSSSTAPTTTSAPTRPEALRQQLTSLGIVAAYKDRDAQRAASPSAARKASAAAAAAAAEAKKKKKPASPPKARTPSTGAVHYDARETPPSTPPPSAPRQAPPPPRSSSPSPDMRSHLLANYQRKQEIEATLEIIVRNQKIRRTGGATPSQQHLVPGGGGGVDGGSSGGVKAVSAKERVLQQKREREQRAEEERLQALEAARVRSHQERQDARQSEYNMYHDGRRGSSKSGVPPAYPVPLSYRMSTAEVEKLSEEELDSKIAVYEDEVGMIRKQIGEILCRLDAPSSAPSSAPPSPPASLNNSPKAGSGGSGGGGVPARAQAGGTPPSPSGHGAAGTQAPRKESGAGAGAAGARGRLARKSGAGAGGGGGGGGGGGKPEEEFPMPSTSSYHYGSSQFMEDSDDDDNGPVPSGSGSRSGSRSRVDRDNVAITGLGQKISNLRSGLESELTKPVLGKAYQYIKDRNPEEDASPGFYPSLKKLLPEDKLHLWVEIDQLIFMEASFGM